MLGPRSAFLIVGCVALWSAPFSSPVLGAAADEPRAAHSRGAAETAALGLPAATHESVESLITEIKTSKELDEAARAEILAVAQEAQTELGRAATFAKQAAKFRKTLERAPESLAELHARLAALPGIARPAAPIDATSTQLEARLSEVEEELSEAQAELTRLEAEPQRRNERRLKGIPEEVFAANQELERIQSEAASPPANESGEMAAARRMLLAARRRALLAEIACATSERESYNAEDELLPKRHDLAARNVLALKRVVAAWQEIVRVRRQREADATLDRAEQEMRFAHPELRGLAEENEKLAERVNQINGEVAAAGKRTVEFANTLSDLRRRFQGMTKKVELGLTQQLGPYLLRFRAELLRQRRKLESVRLPQSQIDAVTLQWLDLTEQRNLLSDLDEQVADALNQLELPDSDSPPELLAGEVRRLLESRRELLDSLVGAYDRYIREIGSLVEADKELFGAFDGQLGYVEERIFWVRSTAQLSSGDLAAAAEALRWYVEPRQWQAVAAQCSRRLRARPLTCLAAGVLFAVLVAAQRNVRLRLRQLGERAARGATDDMTLTVRALVLTLLAAAPWPGLLAFGAWLLQRPAEGGELSDALSHGLSFAAAALAFIEFWRQVCRGRGLGVAHFAWPEPSTRLLRKQLRWFVPLALPLGILGTAAHALDNDRWEALGRLGFIAAMVLLSILIQRVFRPIGGVLHEYLALRRGQWVHRLHHLIFPLSVASPLALAMLTSFGYYYTARQLAWRFQASGALFAAFLFGGALIQRWLLIQRRRLAMRQARLHREAIRQETAKGAAGGDPSAAADAKDELDLRTVNLQTRRFVATALLVGVAAGLWCIWADVLPALSLLNVSLWEVDGASAMSPPEPVKVVHVLAAVLSGILTIAATRNIPGLLEIVLLQRLPFEQATRYAMTTLFRYAIAVTGIVVACLAVGVTWTKIHWLVAAVSVGLGFGLQEIFANFVSGLIILFERPIRVGDIVTIGDVSGEVARIRIRATVITDFDCKELVVPNKEFITGRLLNWTLSDQVNRVCLNVGIAYGSDIEKARALLLQVAKENPDVLKTPAPIASFESFGDSALNLVLRCCLPNPDLEDRLSVVHALNTRIHDEFRDAGIEIAFPQLDLHLRSSAMALYQRQAA